MSEEKTTHSKLSEARRRANKKYNDRFVEMKVRVTPEKRSIIKDMLKLWEKVQLPLSTEPSTKP